MSIEKEVGYIPSKEEIKEAEGSSVEGHLENLIILTSGDEQGGDEQGVEREQIIKSLSDRELFELSFLINNHWKEAKIKGNKEELGIFRSLTSHVAHILRVREEHSYHEVARLDDQELMEKIQELPEEYLIQLQKIPRAGEGYRYGSSSQWDLEGPPELIPLSWQNLVFVRKTDVPPVLRENRLIILKSLRLPTLHWALNSPVLSHSDGCWADKLLTIFAPAEETVEKNDPPLYLNNVNTFWYDTELTLPEHTVFLQEELQEQTEDALRLPKEIAEKYCLITAKFQDLLSWYLLHRAIIQRMGYSFFGGGMWSDTRINSLTRSLREQYGMELSLLIGDETKIEQQLKEEKQEQSALIGGQ